ALRARLGNVHQRTATPPTALASAVSDQGPATIDFAGSGDVVVAWAGPGSGTPVPVLASRRRPDGGWKEPEQIGTHDATRTVPEVHGYPNGMFTALFEHASTVRWTDLVDDRIGPTTILQSPSRGYQRSHRIVVRWSATDEQSRPRDTDVQWRRSGRDNRLGPWRAFRDRTTKNAVRLRGADGHTYCFRARSRDRVGNVGPWSRRRCTSTPVDDRSMRGAGWHRVHDGAAYGNTLTRASRGAGSLKLGEVRARTLRLVARTCPRCGQVQVSQGRRDLGVFSLRSRRVRDKRVIVVADYRRMHEGRVVIRAVTPHERVSIDGLVASR
ncbi:MAG: hypothetical protein ACTHKG_04960, partial [Nocardioides sp.]